MGGRPEKMLQKSYVPIEFLAPCETLLFEPQLGELKIYSQSLQVFF